MSKMFKTLTAPYGRRPESASKLSRDRRERSFGLLLCAVLVPCTIMAQQPLYKNPNAPMEQRADDLLSRMSIEEKNSQLMSDSPGIERLGVPAYNWWNES